MIEQGGFRWALGYTSGMLDTNRISQIVTEAVEAQTAPDSVRRVIAEPDVTSDGYEAIRITIVITPEAVQRLLAGDPVKVLSQIWDRLDEAGDTHFPILEYATEEEMAEIDDSES